MPNYTHRPPVTEVQGCEFKLSKNIEMQESRVPANSQVMSLLQVCIIFNDLSLFFVAVATRIFLEFFV